MACVATISCVRIILLKLFGISLKAFWPIVFGHFKLRFINTENMLCLYYFILLNIKLKWPTFPNVRYLLT